MKNSEMSEAPPELQAHYPELKGAQVSWDAKTGQLKKARGLRLEIRDAAPEQAASQVLERYAPLLGKKEGRILDDLRLEGVSRSPAGYEVSFQQFVGDIPVYRGQVVVYQTQRGQIYAISNSYHPEAEQVGSSRALCDEVEQTQAVEAAVNEVGAQDKEYRVADARLVFYPLEAELRRAWQIQLAVRRPAEAWVVFVDSCTRTVLEKIPSLQRSAR